MLTETVAGRTYDYSHNVGRGAQTGMGFNTPVSMTFGPDGMVYVANRGSETISNVGWNRTGVGQRITKLTIGAEWGDEEFLGEFSKYGNGKGQFIWPAGIHDGLGWQTHRGWRLREVADLRLGRLTGRISRSIMST